MIKHENDTLNNFWNITFEIYDIVNYINIDWNPQLLSQIAKNKQLFSWPHKLELHRKVECYEIMS